MAKSPLGRPPNASIAPRKTPNTPVVEFPALNRVILGPKVLLLTALHGAARPLLLPPLGHGVCSLLSHTPDADGVGAASETTADVANLGES